MERTTTEDRLCIHQLQIYIQIKGKYYIIDIYSSTNHRWEKQTTFHRQHTQGGQGKWHTYNCSAPNGDMSCCYISRWVRISAVTPSKETMPPSWLDQIHHPDWTRSTILTRISRSCLYMIRLLCNWQGWCHWQTNSWWWMIAKCILTASLKGGVHMTNTVLTHTQTDVHRSTIYTDATLHTNTLQI